MLVVVVLLIAAMVLVLVDAGLCWRRSATL
jgi:hypothetical protein